MLFLLWSFQKKIVLTINTSAYVKVLGQTIQSIYDSGS